jgi:uncharacterized membrane protein
MNFSSTEPGAPRSWIPRWAEESPPQVMGRISWFVFLVWSTVGMAIMATGLSEDRIRDWQLSEKLTDFSLLCLHWGDFLFLFFGGCVVFASAWQAMDLRTLRRAVLVIMVGSAVVETIGTLTAVPFGAYTYLGRMGPQLGPLPVAIPVAWWLVVGGFYLTGRRLLPQASARMLCLITALAATGFDWVMEPFAWQVRGYWVWHEGAVPVQNYVAWFVLSFILARLAPLHRAAPQRLDLRPAGVLLLTLLLFVLGRLAASL